MLYRLLATLRLDCPIACDVDTLAWRGVNATALAELTAELGLAAGAIRV